MATLVVIDVLVGVFLTMNTVAAVVVLVVLNTLLIVDVVEVDSIPSVTGVVETLTERTLTALQGGSRAAAVVLQTTQKLQDNLRLTPRDKVNLIPIQQQRQSGQRGVDVLSTFLPVTDTETVPAPYHARSYSNSITHFITIKKKGRNN
ncbi:hypothetical protein ACOMHN_007441 [Nucella lapillus]